MSIPVATTTPNDLSQNPSYISDMDDDRCVFVIPESPSRGDMYTILGTGAGGWSIQYEGSQFIRYNGSTTTTGSGALNSSKNTDCVTIVSSFPPDEFLVISAVGTLTPT